MNESIRCAYNGNSMLHSVALTVSGIYGRPAAAEMPELREVGLDLGLDAMKPWEICRAVCQQIAPRKRTGTSAPPRCGGG